MIIITNNTKLFLIAHRKNREYKKMEDFKKIVRIFLLSFQNYSPFLEASRNKTVIAAIFYSIDKSKSEE